MRNGSKGLDFEKQSLSKRNVARSGQMQLSNPWIAPEKLFLKNRQNLSVKRGLNPICHGKLGFNTF